MEYQRIRAFAVSPLALWIVFLWAAAEAVFFFVVPDVFFLFIVLFAPWRGFLSGLVSVAGSLAGGVLMYHGASVFPAVFERLLDMIPGISGSMMDWVRGRLLADGPVSLLEAPLRGVPYKVFAVEAPLAGVGFWEFMLYTVPSRLQRVIVLCLVVSCLSIMISGSLKKHTRLWVCIYGGCWIGFYIFYVITIGRVF